MLNHNPCSLKDICLFFDKKTMQPSRESAWKTRLFRSSCFRRRVNQSSKKENSQSKKGRGGPEESGQWSRRLGGVEIRMSFLLGFFSRHFFLDKG